MNAQERKALKRAQDSKENWKTKAQERKKQIRLLELRIRDLELSRGQWKRKFFETKSKPEIVKGNSGKPVSKRQTKADRKKN